MDERLRFVARLLDGESMSHVCREFGISRKTGYKIYKRYQEQGIEALNDRSRRPVRYANQLPEPIERLDCLLQEGQAALGGTQDPRAPGAPFGRGLCWMNWKRPEPLIVMATFVLPCLGYSSVNLQEDGTIRSWRQK